MKNITFFLWGMMALSLTLFSSCNPSSKKSKSTDNQTPSTEGIDISQEKDRIIDAINKAPKLIDIVKLLNESGASYIFDLTVPVENIDKMLTRNQKSIGSGMYAFDMNYASVYGRGDVVMMLRENLNRLTVERGIQGDLKMAEKFTERVRQNQDNPDSIKIIVGQMYADFHQYMRQGKNADLYALGTIGMSLEALHVITQATLLASDNTQLLEILNQQDELVNGLETLLEIMAADQHIQPYLEELKPLFQLFEEKEAITADDLEFIGSKIEKVRNSVIQ